MVISMNTQVLQCPGGEGVLPYIGYMGMSGGKGYGFQAIYSGIGFSNYRKLV